MSNRDEHQLTIVGPPGEIRRFAKDFKIIHGELDEVRNAIAAYGGDPSIEIRQGSYYVKCCRVGIVDIEVLIEAFGFDPKRLYRKLCSEYPHLTIMWRYWLDMGWGCGYIDRDGDHRWHEDCTKPHEPEYQITFKDVKEWKAINRKEIDDKFGDDDFIRALEEL